MAKEKEELNLKETKVEEKKVRKKKIETVKKAEEKETKKSTSTKKKTENPKEKSDTTKTKSTSKKAVASKSAEAPKKATSTKKAEKTASTKTKTSKLDTKSTSSKTTNSSKEIKDKKVNKVTPDAEKEIIKEETIIEKIKSFIAKIAAMQEEAKKESLQAKEEKKARKTKKKAEKDEVEEKVTYLPEYYDLPYRYNETIVKILAQTPKRIFVYWDIADEDILRYRNAFGDDFFEKTYPVLLVYNEDKNYTTEIPINDFANSWYIDINDPKTKYTIQLGRKFKEIPTQVDYKKVQEQKIILRNDYLPIAQSNKLEVPNDRILFASLPRVIKFRNVKTYEEKEYVVSEMKTTYGNMYNVEEFYKENYKEEIDDQIFDLNNPSSGGLSSSSFK